jgi:glycosyltransferase involved in cell wall biosynthesis
VLVRALAEPALKSRGVIGLIAGDPWPGAEDRLQRVVALADKLAVLDRLRFVGFRDDVETIYGACDLIAVPSTAPDPLPGAAIEAAAAGCPVIASDAGGLAEIIDDTRTGRLFPAGDGATLAQLVAELLDDHLQRERLASGAARVVRERFAPARLVAGVQGLYDELTGGRRPY